MSLGEACIATPATSGTHAFVAVLNAAGTTLTYATYLAGTTNATDEANGVAVDSSKNVYVTGYTTSTTFPTTTGVYQTKSPNSGEAGFVAKINPAAPGAASLVYSTYLGGGSYSALENGIAVDGSGNAYVAGNAGPDFPSTTGAFSYDGEGFGEGGVYVTKLNPTATALGYSAYLGVGTATGITVDTTGDAYLKERRPSKISRLLQAHTRLTIRMRLPAKSMLRAVHWSIPLS